MWPISCCIGRSIPCICAEHDVILVVAPFRDKLLKCFQWGIDEKTDNDTSTCQNCLSFQCPLDGCLQKICSKHHHFFHMSLQGDEKRCLFSDEHEEEGGSTLNLSSTSSLSYDMLLTSSLCSSIFVVIFVVIVSLWHRMLYQRLFLRLQWQFQWRGKFNSF